MQITIRQETQEDIEHIAEVNRLAFQQDNEANLVDLLRKSDAFIPELSLVALVNHEIVGHILFTKIVIVNEDTIVAESLALAPMAVKPSYQKQGIGTQLVQYGLNKAKALGYSSVIVLGHAHYYPKFGFQPAEKWHIQSPYEVPSEVFMALELQPDGLQNAHGLVRYPKEFDAV